MAERVDEQVSALVDGEAAREELDLMLKRLERDAALRGTWARYHMIGDAMRNGLPERFAPGLADRVATALADEPLPAPAKVAPAPQRRTRGWARPAIGLALAASVAGLVLVGVRPGPGPGAAPVAVAGNTPARPLPTAATEGADRVDVARALQRDRLNVYLVSHNESATLNSMNGVLPYVRMVGYENPR